jgi:hypothetical protein
MRTDHSSLLADTGLSEIELDRMGLVPVERDIDKLHPHFRGYLTPAYRLQASTETGCYLPYDGTYWYEDSDVKILLGFYARVGRVGRAQR